MCPCAGGCVHVRVWNWQDNFRVHRNGKHQEWPRQIWRAQGKRPFSLKTCHRSTAITVPTMQWIRSCWFFTTTHLVKNISATCKCPWCCQVSSCIKPQPLSTSCEYSMWQSGSLHRALRQHSEERSCAANGPLCPGNINLTGQSAWQTHLCVFRLGCCRKFSQKWMKWACLFKENSWCYLQPVTKLELSSKNQKFGKHVSITDGLKAYPHLDIFLNIGGDSNKCDLLKKIKNKPGCWKTSLLGSSPSLGNLLLYKWPACGAAHSCVGKRFVQSTAANQQKLLLVIAGCATRENPVVWKSDYM